MTDEELGKIEILSININTDLCILKNAMTNQENDLHITDLTDFVEKIYKASNEIRNVFVNSI